MPMPPGTSGLTPDQRRSFRASLIWVAFIVVAIVALQLPLPDVVTIGPTWLVPFIELAGIPIVAGLYLIAGDGKRLVTGTMTAFLVFLVLASVMNAVLLLINLVNGFTESGAALLLAGFAVLIVNVLSFGIVYWWIDAGAQGFPFPAAGHGRVGVVAARSAGLPLHRLHQHHRLQPDGHDASLAPGQGALHHPVVDGGRHHRGDIESRHQSHPRSDTRVLGPTLKQAVATQEPMWPHPQRDPRRSPQGSA